MSESTVATRWPKLLAFTSVALWFGSLWFPAFLVTQGYLHGVPVPTADIGGSTESGWEVLLSGWLGPLSVESFCHDYCGQPPSGHWSLLPVLEMGSFSFSAFSWYANLLWLVGIVGLSTGYRPHSLWVFGAAALSMLSLQPAVHSVDTTETDVVPGVGAYVWSFAIALPAIFWPLVRNLPRRARKQAPQPVA